MKDIICELCHDPVQATSTGDPQCPVQLECGCNTYTPGQVELPDWEQASQQELDAAVREHTEYLRSTTGLPFGASAL